MVKRNPLGDVADNPKRYQVSFLSAELDSDVAGAPDELVAEPEALVDRTAARSTHGIPPGVARSKLWNALAGQAARRDRHGA